MIPTIAEAAKLIAAKQLSPVELTRACLDRIGALNDKVHAFITVTEDRALADAQAAEAAIIKDGPKGPLHGIPIGLKDIVDSAGILTTCGSAQLADNFPAEDATCAVRLKAAGTVLMGKLTTHEFANGGPSFDLPFPVARNPWNPDHYTAGSSSGTGAAVAAGMILGGIGTDTGGSIRGPAALCGLAGIKPTYGLVSRAGVAPASFSLDHVGPLAWTAEDCALMLQALAGHDPRDPASADRPVPDYVSGLGTGLKGLRVGILRQFHEHDLKASPATQAGIDAAVALFRDMGASVGDVGPLASLADYHAPTTLISITERAAAFEDWARTRMDRFSARVQRRILLSTFISGTDYVQAVRRRRELTAEMQAAMATFDVVITAGAPGEAPRLDSVPLWDAVAATNFNMPFNLTGYPAITICSGFGPAGLPISLQIAGKPFQEATVLRVADAYEKAMPYRAKRPAMVD